MALPVPPVQIGASTLKASTREKLSGHALRTRAMMPDDAMPTTLTPYSITLHGGGILLRLWVQAALCKEQVKVFGPAGEDVESFARAYRDAEIVILHRTGETWESGDGWLAVAWLDDVDYPASARIHHFVLPDYRTPQITTQLARFVLQYFFEQRGFYFLWGKTPMKNRAAIIFALRTGFTRRPGLSYMMYEGQVCKAVETVLTREVWAGGRNGRKE
jgi:GNAT superfamily N-acetyltransferase